MARPRAEVDCGQVWSASRSEASSTIAVRNPTVENDGVIRAQYGPVHLVANLNAQPRREGDCELAAFGFSARAPGVLAANVKSAGGLDFGHEGISFVAEGDGRKGDVWVYGPAEQEVAVLLPAAPSGKVSVAFDESGPTAAAIKDGALVFRLPSQSGERRIEPPPSLAGKAPCDWPGEKPAIAVLDFGFRCRSGMDADFARRLGPRAGRIPVGAPAWPRNSADHEHGCAARRAQGRP